ncbi:MAG TPA: archease [Thermodesulfobacteriaceae bacterium]|nr:archease [Thermodesulfobacteriaceae bacterium]
MKNGSETFEHGADIGVRGIGRTLAEAFEHGAEVMFSLMVENMEEVRPEKIVEISCESYDIEGLFTAWLNTLLAEADMHGMIFCRFKAEIRDNSLSGTASGEPVDPDRHRLGVEIKGATFTELRVEQEDSGRWIAQCVVDV